MLVWLVRRMVLAPLAIALTIALWVTVPLWVIVAAAVSPLFPGRLRVLRVLWIALLYLTLESLLLLVMGVLWLSAGFGRRLRTAYFEGVHYDLVQLVMWLCFREGRRVARLRIETEGPTPDAFPGSPILVCCRHAGPADSFTLIHTLMDWYGREPRVVLKDTLAWDPAIDVLLRRIPARFISPQPKQGAGEAFEEQIAELATGLDANDAFVIFPEGGNFTEQRRLKAIARLRSLGLAAMADRAEAMVHVLAPRPGGLLAALDAAPEADVVLVAHTGLDHLASVADLWRALPLDKVITMRWWRVSRADIPATREERIEWLFGWWEQVDEWIETNRPVDLPRVRRPWSPV